MKFTVIFTVVIVVTALLTDVRSSASLNDCSGIHDQDRREYCRATLSNSKATCEFIHQHDLRAQCRAEIK